MANSEVITMSMREIDRLKTLQSVIGGNLRAATAARRLGLSKRQVNRLLQRYREIEHSAVALADLRDESGLHQDTSIGKCSVVQ